jgi:hypothetical protein
MALYAYECARHHVVDRAYPMGQQPETVRCDCGKRARFSIRATHAGGSIQLTGLEIPAHFNRSLGCRVESRKHLKELQTARGLENYSPSDERLPRGPSTDWA